MRVFTWTSAWLLTASTTLAQSPQVQFQIVERTGQSQVDSIDNVLDFAVQVMCTTRAVSNIAFDIHIQGELESKGTLARGLISNLDGTYVSGIGTGAVVGRAGLARQYAYLAGITPDYNGLINVSGSTFANGPDQEIGNVAGAPLGSYLLGIPGMDVDADGNPDTWSGNGSGVPPSNGAIAPIDSALRGPYFGRSQWIDVYRFRYTVSDLSARMLHFALDNLVGGTFTQFTFSNGLWGEQSLAGPVSFTPLDMPVVPAPAVSGIACLSLIAALGRRSHRPATP